MCQPLTKVEDELQGWSAGLVLHGTRHSCRDTTWRPGPWLTGGRSSGAAPPGQWTTEMYSKSDADPAPVVSTYKDSERSVFWFKRTVHRSTLQKRSHTFCLFHWMLFEIPKSLAKMRVHFFSLFGRRRDQHLFVVRPRVVFSICWSIV